MEIIFKYDIERLKAYSCNQEYDNQIKIVSTNEVTKLLFPEVDYFNYSFPHANKPLDKNEVLSIIDFYEDTPVGKHKVIVPSDCAESKELCIEFGYRHTKTLVKTSFPVQESVGRLECRHVELMPVDHSNIYDFTCTYLNGFESLNNDYLRIAQNFKLLLSVEEIKLYFLVHNEKYAGINVLYKNGDDYLLAGGAVLKEFRNRHFHKYGMMQRIRQSLDDTNLTGIYSSAYKDSISVGNMLSINMNIAKTYDIYEYIK